MATCMACGAQVADDAKFCTFCGSPLAVAAQPVETDPMTPIDVTPEPAASVAQPFDPAQQPPEPPQQADPFQPASYGTPADAAQQPYQQPAYGTPADQSAYQQPQQQYQQQYQQQPYGQAQPTFAAPAQPAVNDTGSIGWGVLGAFFPIVGLILFLVWKNTKPNSAKVAGIGAIIGVAINFLFMLYTGN